MATHHHDDETDIAAIIERYRAGFAALDPDVLMSIWDRHHDGIVYVAQEIGLPIRGWAEVEAYYRRLPHANPVDHVTEMRVDDLSIDILGDAASAFARFHFEGEIAGRTEPFVADGRATFILHRTAEGWTVIHYHESAPPREPEYGSRQ